MKKITLMLIMLVSAGLCVESLGMYGNDYLIKTNNYVIQLPETLSNPSVIDNTFKVPLVPRITVANSVMTIAPSISSELIQGRKNKMTFKMDTEKDNMRILQEIEVYDEFVKTKIMIQNTGSESVPVEIIYNINSEKSSLLFPSAHTGKISNYIIMTDQNLEGTSLGIISDSDIDTEREISFIRNATSYIFGTKTDSLKKGQRIELTIVYYPFDLRKEGTRPYPINAAPYLENPIIKTEGKVNYELGSKSADKVDQLLESMALLEKRDNGTFMGFYTPNLEIPKDSLGMSAYFKKLCKENDLPCRLKIGAVGNEKYAWISAYFGKWQDVDVYQGVKIKPAGYEVIYEDPSKKVVTYSPENEIESIFLQTRFLSSMGKSYFTVYTLIIILGAISALAILQWKANFFTKMIEKNRTTVTREKISGKYEVLRDSIPDKYLDEILQAVKKKEGKADLSELSEDLRYSEELISFAISYLNDSGYIRKKGDIERTLPLVVSERKEKNPLDKRIIIAAIIIAAIIAIVLLLL